MHKIFGVKCEVSYVDRKGAYLIPFHNDKIGVVQTPKGFFLLGGGIDENETDIECIKRECLEETGYAVSVKEFVCSAETYMEHPVLGHFHPIQMYYIGELKQQIGNPTETDHRLVWMSFEKLKCNMFLEMQSWALEQCYHYNNGDSPKADNCNSHNDEIIELTKEELDEIFADEDFESDDRCEKVHSLTKWLLHSFAPMPPMRSVWNTCCFCKRSVCRQRKSKPVVN